MNLMFRKNFREGGQSKSSGGTKLSKMNRNAGKRGRDMSCSGPSSPDEPYFRTHIFFSANRGGNYQDNNQGAKQLLIE